MILGILKFFMLKNNILQTLKNYDWSSVLTFYLTGHSNYTSLVIRKNREGEVRLAIPLYYLCVVDKYTIDKKTYGKCIVHQFVLKPELQVDILGWEEGFSANLSSNLTRKFAV